jgi:dipeptidyl aminopeptidase/acylaminoacyl peptidase
MPRFAEDIAAGLAWLRARSDFAGNRLALLGHSVGAGAVLLHAARHDDVCAVISLSAFAHPREMMRRFLAENRVRLSTAARSAPLTQPSRGGG